MNKSGLMLRLLLIFILFQSCSEMFQKPMVIGHRGAMGHETENTLASVQKALDLEVDMIEIDVFKNPFIWIIVLKWNIFKIDF